MLQKIHDSVGRWVVIVILGLIAVTFIFWGISGSDFSMVGGQFAAKVNGENIPTLEFERALQQRQNQYQQIYRTELPEDVRREPDLSPAHERWLGEWAVQEHGADFLFVYGQPMGKRPFYTHPDPERPEHSRSFDLQRDQEDRDGGCTHGDFRWTRHRHRENSAQRAISRREAQGADREKHRGLE